MKEPRLWVSNRNGNVFTVLASERHISQLTKCYQGDVRVKRLGASSWCTWAVGHDHRVYIYVRASDVPIRVPVTTYENQRWMPFNGFRSSNLLPTDRRAWSDEHGDIYLPKESIRLPSSHWDWEGDWFIDENLQGEICTDKGGWQYAINFTSRWTAESSWNSCVRKRKWIRFCRFTATDTWAIVSDMEVVENSECFIDIAVGGQMLPNQPADFLSIWGITNNGQVYVRTGACRECPEGKEWQHISCQNMGIINIACGPTGLVWAVTWDGHAIVRTHVSRDAVYGLGWEMVPYPEESTRLMQVSVGRNSVWALSRDGKVWFRQGVYGDKLYWDAKAATGNSWVLMVGEMIHIAVSANDQVFALGQDDEDKEIWFRTGVTPSEPGGKTWQRVVLEEHPDVFDLNSPSSLMSRASQPSLDSPDDPFTMSECLSGLTLQTEKKSSVPMMTLMPSSAVHVSSDPVSVGASRDCVTFSQTSMVSKLKGATYSIQTNGVSAGHVLENQETSLHYEVNAPVSVSPQDRERAKSWLMIENSLQTAPDQEASEAEEADEVTATSELSKDSLCNITSYVSEQNTAERKPAPMISLSACDGSGDVVNGAQKEKTVCDNGSYDLTKQLVSNKDSVDIGSREAEGPTEVGTETILTKKKEINIPASELETVPSMLSSSVNSISDNLDSLESGPSSDVICNFVTDLIEDEDDDQEKTKNNAQTKSSADNGKVTFQDMHDENRGEDKSAIRPTTIPWISLGPSETFTGQISMNPSPSFDYYEPEVIPAMTMTLAQPRYAWGWLAASDFMVENPTSVPWLSASKGSESSIHYQIPKVPRAVRDSILQLLKLRNQKEIHGFETYEHAIEKTTWVKKAGMKVLWQGTYYDCTLEMEQGINSEMDGTLTIQFKLKRKAKVIQMSLQEIRCIKMCDDHHLALYTCDPDTILSPLTLQTPSEAELREWLGTVNMANLSLWDLNCPIQAGSVCSLTVPGHIFIHSPDDTRARPVDMLWGQHGGHMAVVESTPCGVIWAVSFDQTPWVYNGGYGSAFTRELSEMASNLREQVDYRTIRVFENQKWFPVVGYCSRGVLHNNFAWTTSKGKFVKSREDIKLPSSQWQWVSDWMVDFTTEGGVSNDGWQFAINFHRPFHPHQGLRDSVRRRQWSRKCKLVTQGPWVSVGPPELIDISLQVDAPTSITQPLLIWAIGANGDVLCRSDASQAQPMGKSWIHVPTTSDMPFKSVSVGGNYRVWAIAVDGSVWYRAGVTPNRLAGSCWIQVIPPPPGGALLHYISVGGSAVWAVDTGGNLWRREEITQTFPEGTRWSFVCNHVRRVSVGPRDQVWVMSEANFGRRKHSAGAVYRRFGITESTPSGTDWEPVIGPGWHYVSVRGMTTPNK